ncbi:MAG: hypothetical protein AAGF11_32280 [Myxococcota bacterium]
MLRPEHERLLETLIELRPEGPVIAVIASRRITAGPEIEDFLTSRHGFEVVDVLSNEAPLSNDGQKSRLRLVYGLPFLPESERHALLGRLNRGRDRIETLSLQFVVWVLDEDLGELASVAPDLAAWVDEQLHWEGSLEPRELYGLRALPAVEEQNILRRFRPPDLATRSIGQPPPLLWLPRAYREHADAARVTRVADELEVLGTRPRFVNDDGILVNPGREHDVIHPHRVAEGAAHRLKPGSSILFLRGPATGTLPGIEIESKSISQLAKQHQREITVHAESVASSFELTNVLLRHSATIIHYSGYSSSKGLLLLEDKRDVRPIHPQALRRILGSSGHPLPLQCVVLNGNHSVPTARHLVEPPAIASCVIATSDTIIDQQAADFSLEFYRGLFEGSSISGALKHAMAAIESKHGVRAPYVLLTSR